MLTLAEFKVQRRQHLLEFFAWRFGIPNYTTALSYCSGLCAVTISNFRRRPVGWEALERIEAAALHLGFRPPRVLNPSGKFVKPRTLKLPRWSDAAVRIRFFQWRKQTSSGQWMNQFERKPRRGVRSLLKNQNVTFLTHTPAPCRTTLYDKSGVESTQPVDTTLPTSS